jgi:hypothetical protein
MTEAVRRRRRRLPWFVAAICVAVTPLCGSVATAAPTPTPTPTPTEALPVTVELGGITPLAPQPGQTLTLRGRLTNRGTDTVTDLQPRLVVSDTHIGTRGEFDGIADASDGPPSPDAAAVTAADLTIARSTLTPGADTSFSLSVPVDDLHLPETWQVYEMGVIVSGTTPLGVDTVGQLRTFLPWAPVDQPGTGEPTQLAWIWPLVDRPHRITSTGWTDDQLANELRPGGRLDVLLTTAAAAQTQQPPAARPAPRRRRHHKVPPAPPRPTITPVPVTWAVDPMLVQDVQAMDAGYTVGSGKDQRPGAGRAAAQSSLLGV